VAEGVSTGRLSPPVGKLAPGMRLPREVVAAHQRERLITAMLELTARNGYGETSVADVLARARVSRAAFYEHFTDREDCLLGALGELYARYDAETAVAWRRPGLDGRARLRAAIERFAEQAVDWPAAMRVALADSLCAGARAVELVDHGAGEAARGIVAALDVAGAGHGPISDVLARGLAGGVRHVVYAALRDGGEVEPGALGDELAGWMEACAGGSGDGGEVAGGESGGRRGRREGARESAVGAKGAATLSPSDFLVAGAGDLGDAGDGTEPGRDDARGRIVAAVIEALCEGEGGYAALTHREIALRARISYNTLYKHFPGKRDAFLAAVDRIVAQLAQATLAGGGLDGAIGAFAGFLAENPVLGRIALLDVYGAGRAGIERRDALIGGLARMLGAPATGGDARRRERRGASGGGAGTPIAALAGAGGVYEIAYAYALRGQLAGIGESVGELARLAGAVPVTRAA
jgi:AcrR family transcriptional regulator